MKIIREVGGQKLEFELSEAELYLAFREKQEQFDEDDVRMLVEEKGEDEILEEHGITIAEFSSLIPKIAFEMRRQIDKYDTDWWYAREEAVREVIAEYKKGKISHEKR